MKIKIILFLILFIFISCGKFKPFSADKIEPKSINLKMKIPDMNYRTYTKLNGMIIRMHNSNFQEFFHAWDIVWEEDHLRVTIDNAPATQVILELLIITDDFAGDITNYNMGFYYKSPIYLDLSTDKNEFEISITALDTDYHKDIFIDNVPFKLCKHSTECNDSINSCTVPRGIRISSESNCSDISVFNNLAFTTHEATNVYYAIDIYGRYPKQATPSSQGTFSNLLIPHGALCEGVFDHFKGGPPLKVCFKTDDDRIAIFNIELSEICIAYRDGKTIFLNADYIYNGIEIDRTNIIGITNPISSCEDLAIFNRSKIFSKTLYDYIENKM